MLMDAYQVLSNNYTNKYGAVTYYAAHKFDWDKEKYDSHNNHLWTGIANMLLYKRGLLDTHAHHVKSNQKVQLDKFIAATTVKDGLYTRHPLPYLNSPKHDPISLDEYFGIMLSSVALDYSNYAQDSYLYGHANNWCYHDKKPYLNPLTMLTTSLIKSPKATLTHVLKLIKNNDFKGSKATDKIIDENDTIASLVRIRLPKDRYYIKLAAGVRPSIIDYVHNVAALYSTSGKPKDVISGKMLAVFKFLMLQKLGKEDILVRQVKKKFITKLKQDYGDKYLEGLFKDYFIDENHPFHELVKGVKL